MKRLKKFENFEDEEIGEILLSVNSQKPTTWFFIEDAIRDGLLDEVLDIDEEIVDLYGESIGEEMMSMEELSDIISQDFQYEIEKLLTFLDNNDYLSDYFTTITIQGFDEDGEEYDLEYSGD